MKKLFTNVALALTLLSVSAVSVSAAPAGRNTSKLSASSAPRGGARTANIRVPSSNISKPSLQRPMPSKSNTLITSKPTRPALGSNPLVLQKQPGKLTLPTSQIPSRQPGNLGGLKPLKDPNKFPGLQIPPRAELKPFPKPLPKPPLHLPRPPKPPITIPTPPICGPAYPNCPPCNPGPWGGCGNGGWGNGGWGCNQPWFNCGNYYPTPCYTPCYTPWVSYCPTLISDSFAGPISTPIIETVEAAPIAPAAAPASVDLIVEQVVMLEAGDLAKNQGPLIQVSVLNQGTLDAGKFALGLYASLKSEPNAEMVPAGKELTALAAGQREIIEIRLPVQALQMTEQGQNDRQSFKMLFAVADVQNEVTEDDKQNNLLPISATDLLSAVAAR